MRRKIAKYFLILSAVVFMACGKIDARAAVNKPTPVFEGVGVTGKVNLTAGELKIFKVTGTEGIREAEWSVSDESVLAVTKRETDSVTVKALKYGEHVQLTYTYTYIYKPEPVDPEDSGDAGEESEITEPGDIGETPGAPEQEVRNGAVTLDISVSNPASDAGRKIYLSSTSDTQCTEVITISGLLPDSVIKVQKKSSKLYTFTRGRKLSVNPGYETRIYIQALGAANEIITIKADGKVFKIRVVSLALRFNRTSKTIGDRYSNVYVNKNKAVYNEKMSMLALYSGSSAAISLSGAGSNSVRWSTSKPSVASVSGTGRRAVVTGKSRCGYATITATVAGKLKITYQVGVAKRAAVQTLLKGEKAAGAIYSQAKRMQAGYYDCSSFVWRMYKQYGYTFGVRSGWAPTAAAEAQYSTTHYRIISYSGYDESKMLPGDVIFYSSKANGRFMNITHVALYIKPGTRIDAHVLPSYHVGERESTGEDVVMVVRPTAGITKTVSSLKCIDAKKKSLTLSWSPANSVSGYRIYQYNTSKKKYVLYKTLSSKKETCRISGLKAGTKYKFKVCAYQNLGSKKTEYKASVISTKTMA